MNSLSRLTEVEKIYAEEMVEFINSDKVNEVNKVNELKVNNRTDNISLSSIRLHFYSTMISVNRKVFGLKFDTLSPNMPKNEVIESKNSILTSVNLVNLNTEEHITYFNKLFENLCGRSIEIFTLIIQLCGYVGLDIYQNFKEILEEKAEFENHDEEDLKNILRELLIEFEVGARTHNDTKYRFYRDVQAEFMKKVHDAYGFKPTTSSMKKFLRELGFVDKINKKVMKFDNNQTSLVLLYDNKILKSLGLMDENNKRI